MNQGKFNQAYLKALNAADFNALRQLIAENPKRAPKAPCFAEVSTLLESDASDAEKGERCAAIVRQNAVSNVRGTCIGVAVWVALGTALLGAFGNAGLEFYAVNGVLCALYAIFAGVASASPKFSAYAGLTLAIGVLVLNLLSGSGAAGIVAVLIMASALKSLPK